MGQSTHKTRINLAEMGKPLEKAMSEWVQAICS